MKKLAFITLMMIAFCAFSQERKTSRKSTFDEHNMVLPGQYVKTPHLDYVTYLKSDLQMYVKFNDGSEVCLTCTTANSGDDNQILSLDNNIITLSNGSNPDSSVDLTPYLDNTNTFVDGINITGTETKTVTLTRNGLPDLSVEFSDLSSGGALTPDQETAYNNAGDHFYIDKTDSWTSTQMDQMPKTGANAGRRAIARYLGTATVQVTINDLRPGPYENYVIKNASTTTGVVEIVLDGIVSGSILAGEMAYVFEETDGVFEIDIPEKTLTGPEIVSLIDTEIGPAWQTGGGSAQKQYDDMAALLAYSGSYVDDEVVYLNGPQSGNFQYDASDTTSLDDGGTIFVDAAGNRLKRLVASVGESRWFFPDPDSNVDNTVYINKWVEVMTDSDFTEWLANGYYRTTQPIDIAGTNGTEGYTVTWGEGKGLWTDTANTNVIDTRNKIARNIKWRGGVLRQETTTPVTNSGDKSILFFAGGDYSGLEITDVDFYSQESFNGIKLYSQGLGEMEKDILLQKNIFDVGRMGIETVNHTAEEAVRFTNLDILENTFSAVGKIEESIPISLSGKGNDAFIQNNYAENFSGMFVETAGYDHVTIDSNTFNSPNGHLISATSVWGSSHVTITNNKSIGPSQGNLVKLGNHFKFENNELNAAITIQDSKNVSFSGDTFRGSIYGTVVFNGINDSIQFNNVNLMGYVNNSPAIIVNSDTNTNVIFEGGLIKTEGTVVHNANGSTFSPTFKCVDLLDDGVASVLGCNNYDLANQAEAEAGTANDKLMTPETTAQAITAAASTSPFVADANGDLTSPLGKRIGFGGPKTSQTFAFYGPGDLDNYVFLHYRTLGVRTNGVRGFLDFDAKVSFLDDLIISSTKRLHTNSSNPVQVGNGLKLFGSVGSTGDYFATDGTIQSKYNVEVLAPPATNISTGITGTIIYGTDGAIYFCYATDQWSKNGETTW